MSYSQTTQQAIDVARVVPGVAAARQLSGPEQETERLHWALRVTFRALVSPRAWFEAYRPRDDASAP